jgi:uncharacterized protein
MNEVIQLATDRFMLDIHGAHGLSHWQRVESRGLALAAQTGAIASVVSHFAYLHDACRENERFDPQHGPRSADWCQALWRDGYLDLTIPELELLTYACRHHTDGRTQADVTVQTCWDADRLDIGRVGIAPALRFLCTPAARHMLPAVLRLEEYA